ncbi:hypothetical protein Tco_1050376, partial [Tanacetum coccineum]
VEPIEITKPFQHDPAKQQRFEQYMKEKYQGGLRTKDTGGSSKMSEAARARERLEFEAAAEAVTHRKWGKESQSFSEQILGASTAKSSDRSSLLRGDSSQLPFQDDRRLHAKTQADRNPVQESNAYKHDQSNPSSKGKQNPPARKIAGKATRTNPVSAPSKDALEHTKARLDVKVNNGSGPFGRATMIEAIQRGPANDSIIDGLVEDNWKSRSSAGNSLLDLRKIELRVERLKYNRVMELIADVQAMLKGGMQLADLKEFEKFNEIYAEHTSEFGGTFNLKWDVNLNAAAVNVGGRLSETRSSSSFRPTSLTNISDVVNAAAANLGGHLCQPESSSSFCQASSREIFFKSLGDGTASNVV